MNQKAIIIIIIIIIGGSPGYLWSSLLQSSTPLLSAGPFYNEYFNDWAHLLPNYGINSSEMKQLKE